MLCTVSSGDEMDSRVREIKGMLVVSRKEGETIVVPSIGLTIRILQTAGGKAKIGIEAPREVSILRGELQPPKLCSPAAEEALYVAEPSQTYSISS